MRSRFLRGLGWRRGSRRPGPRLSIGMKLALALLMVTLVGGSTGWWGYRSLAQLRTRYEALLGETYPLAITALNLTGEIQAQAQMVMAYAATRDATAIEGIRDSRQRVEGYMKTLEAAGAADPELGKLVQRVEDRRAAFYKMVNTLFVDGDDLSADQLLLSAEQARSVGVGVGKVTNEIVQMLEGRVQAERQQVEAQAAAAVQVMGTLMLVAVVLAAVVVLLAHLLIARPLRRVADELASIASGAGDLTRVIRIRTGDEIQVLADSFNALQQSLAGIVRRIMESSAYIVERTRQVKAGTEAVAGAAARVHAAMGQVAATAGTQSEGASEAARTLEQLVMAIDQIAAGASQQAQQVQGTSLTVSGMVSAMEGVARQAGQAADAAGAAAETARRGAATVDDTLAGMKRIRERVLNAAERIEALNGHTRRIGEIMKVITEIADETNLLALNAAIEAARAGNQGRGFAVVAEEVRRLAERAGVSAKEIGGLVNSIMAGTSEAVTAIGEGVHDVEAGAGLAASAGNALQEILATVEQTTLGMRSISEAAQEVLAASREVAESVAEVAAVTEENTAATEEMAAGANHVRATMADVERNSEDTRVSVEQVSASIQAVNTSMTDIASSSAELTRIAETLQQLVGQFRTD